MTNMGGTSTERKWLPKVGSQLQTLIDLLGQESKKDYTSLGVTGAVQRNVGAKSFKGKS